MGVIIFGRLYCCALAMMGYCGFEVGLFVYCFIGFRVELCSCLFSGVVWWIIGSVEL